MKTAKLKNNPFAHITIDKSLNGKYANDPTVKARAERVRQLLEKHPVPEHLLNPKK